MNPNIVEAEFFNFGNSIKTTVRFRDEYGSITRIAQEWLAAKIQYDTLLRQLESTKGRLRRWMLDRSARKRLEHMCKKESEALQQALKDFAKTVEPAHEIGLEQSNKAFRIAYNDDIYALRQTMSQSTKVWLFIFGPHQDIRADKLKLVAYLM